MSDSDNAEQYRQREQQQKEAKVAGASQPRRKSRTRSDRGGSISQSEVLETSFKSTQSGTGKAHSTKPRKSRQKDKGQTSGERAREPSKDKTPKLQKESKTTAELASVQQQLVPKPEQQQGQRSRRQSEQEGVEGQLPTGTSDGRGGAAGPSHPGGTGYVETRVLSQGNVLRTIKGTAVEDGSGTNPQNSPERQREPGELDTSASYKIQNTPDERDQLGEMFEGVDGVEISDGQNDPQELGQARLHSQRTGNEATDSLSAEFYKEFRDELGPPSGSASQQAGGQEGESANQDVNMPQVPAHSTPITPQIHPELMQYRDVHSPSRSPSPHIDPVTGLPRSMLPYDPAYDPLHPSNRSIDRPIVCNDLNKKSPCHPDYVPPERITSEAAITLTNVQGSSASQAVSRGRSRAPEVFDLDESGDDDFAKLIDSMNNPPPVVDPKEEKKDEEMPPADAGDGDDKGEAEGNGTKESSGGDSYSTGGETDGVEELQDIEETGYDSDELKEHKYLVSQRREAKDRTGLQRALDDRTFNWPPQVAANPLPIRLNTLEQDCHFNHSKWNHNRYERRMTSGAMQQTDAAIRMLSYTNANKYLMISVDNEPPVEERPVCTMVADLHVFFEQSLQTVVALSDKELFHRYPIIKFAKAICAELYNMSRNPLLHVDSDRAFLKDANGRTTNRPGPQTAEVAYATQMLNFVSEISFLCTGTDKNKLCDSLRFLCPHAKDIQGKMKLRQSNLQLLSALRDLKYRYAKLVHVEKLKVAVPEYEQQHLYEYHKRRIEEAVFEFESYWAIEHALYGSRIRNEWMSPKQTAQWRKLKFVSWNTITEKDVPTPQMAYKPLLDFFVDLEKEEGTFNPMGTRDVQIETIKRLQYHMDKVDNYDQIMGPKGSVPAGLLDKFQTNIPTVGGAQSYYDAVFEAPAPYNPMGIDVSFGPEKAVHATCNEHECKLPVFPDSLPPVSESWIYYYPDFMTATKLVDMGAARMPESALKLAKAVHAVLLKRYNLVDFQSVLELVTPYYDQMLSYVISGTAKTVYLKEKSIRGILEQQTLLMRRMIVTIAIVTGEMDPDKIGEITQDMCDKIFRPVDENKEMEHKTKPKYLTWKVGEDNELKNAQARLIAARGKCNEQYWVLKFPTPSQEGYMCRELGKLIDFIRRVHESDDVDYDKHNPDTIEWMRKWIEDMSQKKIIPTTVAKDGVNVIDADWLIRDDFWANVQVEPGREISRIHNPYIVQDVEYTGHKDGRHSKALPMSFVGRMKANNIVNLHHSYCSNEEPLFRIVGTEAELERALIDIALPTTCRKFECLTQNELQNKKVFALEMIQYFDDGKAGTFGRPRPYSDLETVKGTYLQGIAINNGNNSTLIIDYEALCGGPTLDELRVPAAVRVDYMQDDEGYTRPHPRQNWDKLPKCLDDFLQDREHDFIVFDTSSSDSMMNSWGLRGVSTDQQMKAGMADVRAGNIRGVVKCIEIKNMMQDLDIFKMLQTRDVEGVYAFLRDGSLVDTGNIMGVYGMESRKVANGCDRKNVRGVARFTAERARRLYLTYSLANLLLPPPETVGYHSSRLRMYMVFDRMLSAIPIVARLDTKLPAMLKDTNISHRLNALAAKWAESHQWNYYEDYRWSLYRWNETNSPGYGFGNYLRQANLIAVEALSQYGSIALAGEVQRYAVRAFYDAEMKLYPNLPHSNMYKIANDVHKETNGAMEKNEVYLVMNAIAWLKTRVPELAKTLNHEQFIEEFRKDAKQIKTKDMTRSLRGSHKRIDQIILMIEDILGQAKLKSYHMYLPRKEFVRDDTWSPYELQPFVANIQQAIVELPLVAFNDSPPLYNLGERLSYPPSADPFTMTLDEVVGPYWQLSAKEKLAAEGIKVELEKSLTLPGIDENWIAMKKKSNPQDWDTKLMLTFLSTYSAIYKRKFGQDFVWENMLSQFVRNYIWLKLQRTDRFLKGVPASAQIDTVDRDEDEKPVPVIDRKVHVNGATRIMFRGLSISRLDNNVALPLYIEKKKNCILFQLVCKKAPAFGKFCSKEDVLAWNRGEVEWEIIQSEQLVGFFLVYPLPAHKALTQPKPGSLDETKQHAFFVPSLNLNGTHYYHSQFLTFSEFLMFFWNTACHSQQVVILKGGDRTTLGQPVVIRAPPKPADKQ